METRTAFKISIVVFTAIATLALVAVPLSMRNARSTVLVPIDLESIQSTELDETAARALFPAIRDGDNRRARFDPVTLLALQPDQSRAQDHSEHPNGEWMMRTNNRGFREDTPTVVEKGEDTYRILVAGDSHTEGLVDNRESFPNVLERRLAEEIPGRSFDVVNAGVATMGPYNYLQVLKKNLDLAPDLFVAAFFVGNDFNDAVTIQSFLDRRKHGPWTADARKRLQAAAKKWPAQMAQGAYQAFRFHHHPEETKIGLESSVRWFDEIRDLCKSCRIGFLAVIIPIKYDVDLRDDRPTYRQFLSSLDLTGAELALNRRLGQRFVRMLGESGIDVLDPTEAMRECDDVLYWREDYHINVLGHAFLAERILENIEDEIQGPGILESLFR